MGSVDLIGSHSAVFRHKVKKSDTKKTNIMEIHIIVVVSFILSAFFKFPFKMTNLFSLTVVLYCKKL
jgi:hypothetical protein